MKVVYETATDSQGDQKMVEAFDLLFDESWKAWKAQKRAMNQMQSAYVKRRRISA